MTSYYLNINWDEMLESPSKTVDENWEDFKSVLLKGMNMFIPKGKKSPIKSKKNFHPFNRELQQLIHKKTSTLESLDHVQKQTSI